MANKAALRVALAKLKSWRPQDTPIQFRAKYNPYNFGAEPNKWLVAQDELDSDKQAPFFTEAYLYSLLGKEDARTLLTLLRRVEEAADE